MCIYIANLISIAVIFNKEKIVSLKNAPSEPRLPIRKLFRHLLVFQFKLLVDAGRDLVLSPLSLVVFTIDAVFRPRFSKSLTLRLMILGRKSDRVINLFNEYSKTDIYTLDEGVSDFEKIMQKKMEQRREKEQRFDRED